tara:strand:- start:5804 stop:6253 length:450 start_codon:yes stop_codon:yes gene_type:complete
MAKGQLQSWLDQDWVRIGADGTILGSCGSRKEAEGKPKCLPRSKAESLSKAERAKLVARKRRKDPNKDRKGKPINVSNKLKSGGFVKLNNPGKADLNKDGSLSSYEKKRGMAIERSMAKQNKLQMKNGGFVAKGCGNIMPNRKKVTTIS